MMFKDYLKIVFLAAGFGFSGLETCWAQSQPGKNSAAHLYDWHPVGDNSWRAKNLAQGWKMSAKEQRTEISNSTASWTWWMRPTGIGYATRGCELGHNLNGSLSTTQFHLDQPTGNWSCGNRYYRGWGEGLTEWSVNTADGYEFGFTVWAPPIRVAISNLSDPKPIEKSREYLVLRMEAPAGMPRTINNQGTAIRWLSPEGAVALSFVGLTVTDADGHVLHSYFTATSNGFEIRIADVGARYPLKVDPIAQVGYIKPSNTHFGQNFGVSMDMNGATLAVGSHRERGPGQGVGPTQAPLINTASGAVYIFSYGSQGITQSEYIKASHPGTGDLFGASVAFDGTTLVIGAPGESSQSVGVGGDELNDAAPNSGAAYVFQRSAGVWTQVAYLKASNTGTGDQFGYSVAVDGNRIVVGAPLEDSASVLVDGDGSDNSVLGSGAAYIFEQTGGGWSQAAYLKATAPSPNDEFGTSVACSGSWVGVGSPTEGNGVLVNAITGETLGGGAAFVYQEEAGLWSFHHRLKAEHSDPGDDFGISLAFEGTHIWVGAPGEDGAGQTGGDASDNSNQNAGAVYEFERTGSLWNQSSYIKPVQDTGSFGFSLDAFGSRVITGAVNDGSSGTGVDGDSMSGPSSGAGAAFIFKKTANGYIQEAFLKASNTNSLYFYGSAVCITEGAVCVGSQLESALAFGINDDGSNKNASVSGAAYLYDLDLPVTTFCEQLVPTSAGEYPLLQMLGSTSIPNDDVTLRIEQLPINQAGYFLNSRGRDFVFRPRSSKGNLCLGGGFGIGRHLDSMQTTGPFGVIEYTLNLQAMVGPMFPAPVLAGEVWHFQLWYRDPFGSFTSHFSNGLSIEFD